MAGLTRPSIIQRSLSRKTDPRVKPGGDDLTMMKFLSFNAGSRNYFIACGLIGLPVPPVMISGGPQKKNS